MPQSEPEFGVNDMAEFAKFDAYAEREEGAELAAEEDWSEED
jgi:hypothetical protein